MSTNEWRDRARRLADQLDSMDVLGAGWRDAFEQVPRHVFVPRYFAGNELVDGADSAQHERWLDAVYSDDPLVTQRTEVPGTNLFLPTSSSTRPSLMARMLGLLNANPQDRVLEIGTGTGYNAALLAHRLGDANVTSIDIDANLVDTARAHLAEIGYRPHLVAGDGAAGVSDRAPFTRILATAGVGAVPAAWVAQLADQGLAVLDVRGELTSSLTVLHKTYPDKLIGWFLPVPGHFMWLRADAGNPLRHGGTLATTFDRRDPHTTTTAIPPADLQDSEFGFLLAFKAPGIQWIGPTTTRDGREVVAINSTDASWVEVSTEPGDAYEVVYGGPTDLWSRIAQSHASWQEWGRPRRTRFGLTAHDDGRQEVWLDEPGQTIA